ncbi:Major facilitator superfamily multidrug transporter NAG4 [Psilocybe cubensis]|uniref:Major facilitator superfamily multidrug transporter NAG4 n=2 Tax=Psilocybe cubensis TaxID=181762 RepID=A0ACB8GK10_PSICU|nr:Major facilitator superfamily multidrug transporter NAG4 [Psilocybe cubensis]KAH9475800.1 Major facilitator superfamily multidrug transporter NAG4 [Psilocybe cubensis]
MPSEPIEAEFARPPVLSKEQEEEFRTLEQENIPAHASGVSTPGSVTYDGNHVQFTTIDELEKLHTKEGYKLVTFEKGKGEDPRDWGKGKKWYVTATTALLCLAVALGSSIITGDMTGPTKEMGISQEITNLTVTCFVMGFGIGPLFMSPLSEVVGRRPIYCISMFLYFIFTLPSALAHNAATLVVARMIAGIAASAPMCNIGGSLADVWAIEDRGIPMAVFSTTLFIGPCLGPMVGGWIGMYAGWRWIYWVLFILLGVSFALTLFIPETLAPVLLRRKAEALRKSTGDERHRTLEEIERLPFRETLKIALIRPFQMLTQEPIVIIMSFYLSFVYSLLYLLFFAFPIALEEIRGFNPGITGTSFVSIMLGIVSASMFLPLQERAYAKVTKFGTFPEARLYPMMFGSNILPVALIIFAFTGAYAWVHWIAVCIAGYLFGFAMILIYVSANSYIIDSYSDYAASAMAAKTFLRSECGAMIPLFVTQMFHGMGFQWAGLLLALVALAIAPVPFVFYKYGHKVRAHSARATQTTRSMGPEAVSEKA